MQRIREKVFALVSQLLELGSERRDVVHDACHRNDVVLCHRPQQSVGFILGGLNADLQEIGAKSLRQLCWAKSCNIDPGEAFARFLELP